MPSNLLTVLVRGSGDVGSAVAHGLFRAGYAVVLHDSPQPTTTRRKMAFTDAIFDGCALLEGVVARRVDNLTFLPELLATREAISLVVVDLAALLDATKPDVLIDARMRKHHQPEGQCGLAPLTIGLGPNFVAGETTDLAVETSWGDELGRVYDQGATKPLAGEPRPIAGHGRDRYVYAPVAGVFHTSFQIGDLVSAGEIIARIDAIALTAPLAGAIRGLTRAGVPVTLNTKVIEIDPRGPTAVVTGIGERPSRIAEGVLAAVQRWAKKNRGWMRSVEDSR
jgi:xanthine dehydrogenase accessory factor